jgi:hypothetical protein
MSLTASDQARLVQLQQKEKLEQDKMLKDLGQGRDSKQGSGRVGAPRPCVRLVGGPTPGQNGKVREIVLSGVDKVTRGGEREDRANRLDKAAEWGEEEKGSGKEPR